MLPTFSGQGNVVLFIAASAIILSMYGGGFATIPAYLADIFGTRKPDDRGASGSACQKAGR